MSRNRKLLETGLSVFVLAAIPLGHSAPPADYYDSAIGPSGQNLKAALHETIKGQTVIPYTSSNTDTWDALMVLDEAPSDPARVVLIYSGLTNLKTNNYQGGVGAGKWDREHLWPQSYGLVAISASSRAKSDLFNLRPIDYTVNATRGNLYYDITTTPYHTIAGAPGSSYDSNSWEPRDADKGVVARAAFYMAVRYDGTDADVPDLELSDTPNAAAYQFGKLSTLLAWHRQFPPTDAERTRNQSVFLDYQHNRNPFIDRPEFADVVFSGASLINAWRAYHFTAAELENGALSGDAADLDGDGYATLLEYTFHSDPRRPELNRLVTANTVMIGGARYVNVTFPHNRFATDVTTICEGSEDMATWEALIPDSTSTVATDFETEQMTVRFAAPTLRFFVRVRVEFAPAAFFIDGAGSHPLYVERSEKPEYNSLPRSR